MLKGENEFLLPRRVRVVDLEGEQKQRPTGRNAFTEHNSANARAVNEMARLAAAKSAFAFALRVPK